MRRRSPGIDRHDTGPLRSRNAAPWEPEAIRIARRLHAAVGEGALAKAQHKLALALQRDQIGHADLFHAVCVILRNREGAFTRLRRTAPR